MNAKELYAHLDKRLKTDNIWTKEQAEIYSVLKLLLHEHSLSKKFYKVNANHSEYLKFILEQDWLKEDKDKLYVHNVIKSCVLLEHPINREEGIKIVLLFRGFDVTLTGFYDKKLGIFYVYFSKNSNEPAYLAYYNTHKDTKEQHVMRLPEFEKIYKVSGFLDTMLKKSSLIRFVVDTFRFYKCEMLLHHAVGLRYDVTLDQIYSKIRA
jgi:hypothetical protein